MLRNKRGIWPLPAIFYVAATMIGVITVRGTVDSASTGNLKKGFQTIGCKMQGKTACDYGFIANDPINPMAKK